MVKKKRHKRWNGYIYIENQQTVEFEGRTVELMGSGYFHIRKARRRK